MEAADSPSQRPSASGGMASDVNASVPNSGIPQGGPSNIANETAAASTKDPSVGVKLVLEHQSRALLSGEEVIFAKCMGDSSPPIVSADEIAVSEDLCPERVHGSKILQLPDSRILKVGQGVGMGEAEAICLVSRETNVPVPRVHNAYMIGIVGYILMDLVHGISLTDCWSRLLDKEQKSIVEQLRGYVDELREIEGEFIGGVDGGPCDEVLFKHPWGQTSPTYGPFSTRQEFNKGVSAALRNSRPNEVFTEADKVLEADILASGTGDASEKMVLTHGDLNRGNIIVHEGVVTGIVDWGAAGYSIPEMEYFSARLTSDEASWDTAIGSFIPVFEKERDFWLKFSARPMLKYEAKRRQVQQRDMEEVAKVITSAMYHERPMGAVFRISSRTVHNNRKLIIHCAGPSTSVILT
ncbi:hypothetical protein FQN54_003343 [Arachnomyces sp. PD_36]|nr:hypothetical protein FQN54_003343 [Arachnomyces sp. PD_36]